MLKQWASRRDQVSRGALLVALVFFLAALLGLFLVDDSGIGVDEAIERRTLNVNIRAYVELFTGEGSEAALAISEEDIDTWRDRDYGQAKFYPVWPIMNALEQAGNTHGMENVYHYYMHLLFLLGLFGLYSIVRQLTGSRAFGLVAAGLLYVNPRFFAESFYNNKDVVLVSLCLIVWWMGLRFITKDTWESCIWFGLAGAVAANARILGLAAFGLCGIAYLVVHIANGRWDRRLFLRGFAAVASFLVFFTLLTPACWSDFFGFWKYLIVGTANFDTARWNGWVLYRGALYNAVANPIPWHYIPWLMLITTPLFIVVLAALWGIQLLVRNRLCAQKWLCLESVYCIALAVFFAAPLVYTMVVHPNLYNGWRHMYFIYIPVVVLAGVGAAWLWQHKKKWLRIALCASLAANFLYYAGFIIANHPYEFAYFNFLAGEHPEERYEADYWYIGQSELMKQLQEMDADFSAVPLNKSIRLEGTWYRVKGTMSGLTERNEEVTWDRRGRARYVLENTCYAAIDDLSPNWDLSDPAVQLWKSLMNAEEPILEIKCGRTVLWRVYKNPQYNGPPYNN